MQIVTSAHIERKLSTKCRCGGTKVSGRFQCKSCNHRTLVCRKNREKMGKIFPEPVWILESYMESTGKTGRIKYPCFYVCTRFGENRCDRVGFRWGARLNRVEAFTRALGFAWTCWLVLKGRNPQPGEIKIRQSENLKYCKPFQDESKIVWRRLN